MKLTVDASIVIKWYVSETYSEEARLVLGHRLERYAPDFVLIELANILWKKARRSEIGDPHAYFQELSRVREAVVLSSSANLIERAAEIAAQIDHPVYDCLYITCAEATGSTLITADRRLRDRVADDALDVDVQYIGEQGVADSIRAAATALVIAQDKVAELVAAYDLLLETTKNVLDSVTVVEAGSQHLWTKDSLHMLNSPASRRLMNLIAELDDEETIDLLALGLLGQGHSGAEWQPNFEHACSMINASANDEMRVVPYDCEHWRAGYERLTGTSI